MLIPYNRHQIKFLDLNTLSGRRLKAEGYSIIGSSFSIKCIGIVIALLNVERLNIAAIEDMVLEDKPSC